MNLKDTNGRETLTYQGIGSGILNSSVTPFGQNEVGDSAYKRAERLSLATYLVTNFIPESENVRESIRTRACALLDETMLLKNGLRSSGHDRAEALSATVRILLSLLDNAHASGYISDMNLAVLKQAYIRFVEFIRDAADSNYAEALAVKEEFFFAPNTARGAGAPAPRATAAQTNTASQTHANILRDKKSPTKNLKDTSKTTNSQRHMSDSKLENKRNSLKTKRVLTERRSEIVDVIAQKHRIRAAEIAKILPQHGAKTIQRELNTLISEGLVEKVGVKRWTVYKLV